METFGKICAIALSIIASSLLGGFVFSKLWEWFIVYAFNVQSVTVIQSIGILFFLNFITHKVKSKSDTKFTWQVFVEKFVNEIVILSLSLGIGWMITLFQ